MTAGLVRVTMAGATTRLRVYRLGAADDDEAPLFIYFRDATNGLVFGGPQTAGGGALHLQYTPRSAGRSMTAATAATTSSASWSVSVRDKSCKINPKATLFRPVSTPLPW